ncbi:acyltransferase family protein [Nocardioides zeicaulis]|uniref:Acyltransferase family protein n=1 Tax=Nocardioides zeicaulis TaxID=1776857 RepID=A0ABV6DZR5_9ACTN
MNLRDAVVARPNALNLVRLVLASFVIVSHTWPIGRFGDLWGGEPPFGRWAVSAFFCLSGFLVARSRLRLSIGRFFWHRGLRIFPAAWVCLAVVVFVLAPLSLLKGGEWSPRVVVGFLVRDADLVHMVFGISGTVADGAWVGSMWSLEFELLAYLVAAVLLAGWARRHAVGAPAVALLVLTVWGGSEPHAWQWLLGMFVAGMLVQGISDRVPVSGRLAALSVVALVVLHMAGWERSLWPLPLCYLVLWLGVTVPASWAPRSDISYGVYLYGFPVQVTIEWFLPGLPLVGHMVLALAVSYVLAYASWTLVERPALRLKDVAWSDLRRRSRTAASVR